MEFTESTPKHSIILFSTTDMLTYIILLPYSLLQSEKIVALTAAANVPVEPIWATLLAKALEGKDVKELLTNVGSGGGAPAAVAAPSGGAAAGGAAAEEKAEEKKEEEKEESDGAYDVKRRILLGMRLANMTLAFPIFPLQTTWASVCSTKRFTIVLYNSFDPIFHIIRTHKIISSHFDILVKWHYDAFHIYAHSYNYG
jgi:large subunit ribosomal protein LP1